MAKIKGYSRTLSESISISDTLARVITTFRGLSEAITITDSLARTVIRYVTISDSVSITDAIGILSGRARSTIAYLTKRAGDTYVTFRSVSSYFTKRTANARTDEF